MTDWKVRSLTEGRRLLRFGVVGLAALGVYWSITNAITSMTGVPLLAASIVGYVAAGLTSYLGHAHFSFRVQADHAAHGPRFFAVALFGLLINVVLVQVCSAAGFAASLTTAIVGVSMPVLNYAFNRLWVFGPGLDKVDPSKETF